MSQQSKNPFPSPVAFLGLGNMGAPMAHNLLRAGTTVRGYDRDAAARAAFAAAGGLVPDTAAKAVAGAGAIITMLPDGGVVARALAEPEVAAALAPGAVVIDMSSSAPLGTRALGAELATRGLTLVDAPVSGGVSKAETGTLAIFAGGDAVALDQVTPILSILGDRIFRTGALGSGHAVKALNNYVSAAGLRAACEALTVAQTFGIDGATFVDAVNASTGRNNSTEAKLKPFVLSGTYASGFAAALMAKDIRTARDLAEDLGLTMPGLADAAETWTAALETLPEGADHTEIHRLTHPKPEPSGP